MNKNQSPISLIPPFRLMFVARSQSGKTTLLIKLLLGKWLDLFDKIYIFCPTYSQDLKWSGLDKHIKTNKLIIYPVVKNVLLNKIWKNAIKKKEEDETYQTLIIMDDCMGQKDFKSYSDESVLNKLTCKGNHANVSTVWSIQKLTMCTTVMRCQAEGIIVFYIQANELKTLYQEYGTGSLKLFQKMVESATSKPYSCLFINRQGPGRPRYFCNFREINLESLL